MPHALFAKRPALVFIGAGVLAGIVGILALKWGAGFSTQSSDVLGVAAGADDDVVMVSALNVAVTLFAGGVLVMALGGLTLGAAAGLAGMPLLRLVGKGLAGRAGRPSPGPVDGALSESTVVPLSVTTLFDPVDDASRV